MKKIIVACLFCMFILLAGCSAGDKADFIEWMHEMEAEQTEVFFWSQPIMGNPGGETELTPEEEQELLSILDGLTKESMTWNKHLAGITPEYGFHLVVSGEDYNIDQAGAPHGQTEISYQGKQWWIESADLFEFLKSFLDVS